MEHDRYVRVFHRPLYYHPSQSSMQHDHYHYQCKRDCH